MKLIHHTHTHTHAAGIATFTAHLLSLWRPCLLDTRRCDEFINARVPAHTRTRTHRNVSIIHRQDVDPKLPAAARPRSKNHTEYRTYVDVSRCTRVWPEPSLRETTARGGCLSPPGTSWSGPRGFRIQDTGDAGAGGLAHLGVQGAGTWLRKSSLCCGNDPISDKSSTSVIEGVTCGDLSVRSLFGLLKTTCCLDQCPPSSPRSHPSTFDFLVWSRLNLHLYLYIAFSLNCCEII